MALSKAASSPLAAPRRSVGRPSGLEARVSRIEDAEAWREVRKSGRVIHYAVTAERPDVVLHMAGQIVSLADRRLRQLGGGDAA